MSKTNETPDKIPSNKILRDIFNQKIDNSTIPHLHKISVYVYGHELTIELRVVDYIDSGTDAMTDQIHMIARELYTSKDEAIKRAKSIQAEFGDGEYRVDVKIYKRDKVSNLELIKGWI